MALLVTLFLVLVNIFNAITTNSPKADGLNALQVYFINRNLILMNKNIQIFKLDNYDNEIFMIFRLGY